MTAAEKLRFLADRVEDEKEFYIDNQDTTHRFRNFKLMYLGYRANKSISISQLSLNSVLSSTLKLKPRWEFTEDEKVILRNLPTEYGWIARDKSDNGLYAYTLKTTKSIKHWLSGTDEIISLNGFSHLFQCIKWSDDESCEFRKYI